MTSIVTLILVLSLTSSGVFSLPLDQRNIRAGQDDENEVGNPEARVAPQGATDFIEAANAGLGRLRANPNIQFGDIAQGVANRNAAPCTATGCTWPKRSNGFVYVPVHISSMYSSADRIVIIDSLVEFHSVSCIRFVWRKSHKDYLYFCPFTGCWSYVGRQGGRQTISIQKRGCVHTHVIQHEILHALGFHHEQSRSDRDNFVKILTTNIKPEKLNNFNKVNTNNLGTPYDYSSIMHYSRYAFSKKRGVLPSIVPFPNPKVVIGQATEMSGNDIKRLNHLYKCSAY